MPTTLRNTDILMNSGAAIQDPPGTAPGYVTRAWVNFNGTGTPAIRASGNVSSITDGGVGLFTINFTTALVDANYAVVGFAKRPDDVVTNIGIVTARNTQTYSNTAVAIATLQGSWSMVDFPTTCLSVYR